MSKPDPDIQTDAQKLAVIREDCRLLAKACATHPGLVAIDIVEVVSRFAHELMWLAEIIAKTESVNERRRQQSALLDEISVEGMGP